MTNEMIGMFEMNLGHGNDDAPSMPYYGEFIENNALTGLGVTRHYLAIYRKRIYARRCRLE